MRIALNIVILLQLIAKGQIFTDSTSHLSRRVSQILILGNHRTKESIIRREMDLYEGAILPTNRLLELIEKNRNRVFNTGLFVNVQITADTTYKEELRLYVMVTERWYTIPTVVFELADRNFNEWWYQRRRDLARVNYGLGLSQHNIRGRNESLRLNIQAGFTKNMSGSYSIPYINKAKTLGLSFGGGYSENKQVLVYSHANKQVFIKSEKLLYAKTNAYATLSYRRSFFTIHRLNYDYTLNYASDSVLTLNRAFFGTQKNINSVSTLVYNLIHDKRNIQAYPTKGHMSYLDIKVQGLWPTDYFRNQQLSITHARYYELAHKVYITSKTKLLLNSNDRLPYLNLRTLGYSNDYIRGYDLYVIDASCYAYHKLNVRKKIIQYQVDLGKLMPLPQFRSFPISIYLNSFADVGYGYKKYVEPRNMALLNRSLEGWGLGLDIVTAYDVVLRTEYSFNELGEHRLFFYVSTDVVF